ncbi:checkpoint protein HUS1 [Folsomia candida]|uniref:checkpoint protein HUS1 n=1 Tax=Folsomia candida TaxID=158441 RepID=UPI000B8F1E84|nr:checkpoint protein HUS1 [Folsomia candida]
MKFRGKITDAHYIRLFSHFIGTLNKFSKVMVLRVMPDKLAFLLHDKLNWSGADTGVGSQTVGGGGVGGGATAWGEVPIQPYFSEFKMIGISQEENEIYMELGADAFASSLSTLKLAQDGVCLKMKLTKKVVPCLTLEIGELGNNISLTCTHDIAVHIIPKKNWSDYQCPNALLFNISLTMPELKHLRLMIERMRNVSQKLIFKMGKEGKLVLSVVTYNVESKVTFNDLTVIDSSDDEDRPLTPVVHGSEAHYSVEVDMKSILHLLPPEGAKPTSMIFSIADSRLLHCLFYFGDLQIQYFVPGTAAI